MLPTVYIHPTLLQNIYAILMYHRHVSATSTVNVLRTNTGGKFQSVWEATDVSTIITSSKSNHHYQDWFIWASHVVQCIITEKCNWQWLWWLSLVTQETHSFVSHCEGWCCCGQTWLGYGGVRGVKSRVRLNTLPIDLFDLQAEPEHPGRREVAVTFEPSISISQRIDQRGGSRTWICPKLQALTNKCAR